MTIAKSTDSPLRILGSLRVGNYSAINAKDQYALRIQEDLESRGFKLSSWAKAMIENKNLFSLYPKSQQILIGDICVEDLGFAKGANMEAIRKEATTKTFRSRGKSYSLEMCLPEVAPQFCIQHANNDFTDEMLRVAMESIPGEKGLHAIFSPKWEGGEKILDALYAPRLWDPKGRFIFSCIEH